MKDIFFYVADKSMKEGIEGLLSLLFPDRKLSEFCDFYIEPYHDPGIYKNASSILRNYLQQCRYAMVLLDREGSGQEKKTCEEIERIIEENLVNNGWIKDNVKVIVFDPELEIWLWVESQNVSQALGWNDYRELKERLISEGFWERGEIKPNRPKESMEYALKKKGIPRSSSIYKKIAKNIRPEIFCMCKDTSFKRFIETLERWFDKKWIRE